MLATAVAVLATAPGALGAAIGTDAAAANAAAKAGSGRGLGRALGTAELRGRARRGARRRPLRRRRLVFGTRASGDGLLFADSSSSRGSRPRTELFVTAALLAELGPAARLQTRVYARGGLDGRRDSVVAGDLVIVGDGDPPSARPLRPRARPTGDQGLELARNVAAAEVQKPRSRGGSSPARRSSTRERRAAPTKARSPGSRSTTATTAATMPARPSWSPPRA